VRSAQPIDEKPFPPNRLFVGRADDLKALAQALKAGGSAVGQVAAATGMGGIGKTQLATEFAHRYGPFFAGGVFWVSCKQPKPKDSARKSRKCSCPPRHHRR
jgi:hypothetical protein